MKPFLELDEDACADSVVIVDVDGTLTHDKSSVIGADVIAKLVRMGRRADLYLFSNGLQDRTRQFAELHGLRFLETPYRKPSARVVESLVHQRKKIVVIGDKAITDGLFASNIGAHFIPVQKMRHAGDSFLTRAVYLFDDVASFFVWMIFPILPFIQLMRPKQWIKNLLVLAPLFFAAEAFDTTLLFRAIVAALIFCLVSSSMYIFNDLLDVEQDRLHPRKRMRPLASGAVGILPGWIFLGALFVVSVLFVAILPSTIIPIVLYLIGNVAYTLWLKHIAIFDLACVAFFYVLRIIAGGEATSTYVSPWLILCVLFGALFMTVGKRRGELVHAAKRKVLEYYSRTSLDYLLAASAVLAITSYGLYSVLGAKSPFAVYSTLFVFIAIFRLLNRMYLSAHEGEYPEELLFKDPGVLCAGAIWALYMFVLFYLRV